MTLEGQFPEIVAAQPQLVAQHCALSALTEKAVGYQLKAGQQAVARWAMGGSRVAVAERFGPPCQLAMRRPAVRETSARARELAEQLDRSDYLVFAPLGQWLFHSVRSE
jgi:hypothetical protein